MMVGGNGMRDINKAHPFIILLRKRNGEMDTYILETTKKFLIFSISTVLMAIISYLFTRKLEYLWIFAILGIWNISTSYLFIRRTAKSSYTEEIYNFIYSEEFNTVYVNDERLINMIESTNRVFGILEFINEKIIFDSLIQMIILVLYFYFVN